MSAAAQRLEGMGEMASEQSQYLTFMLGGEVFAIGILAIKEIIEYDNVTAVPMMPECVRGVINLRGAVVPVIDLSVRFGRSVSQQTRRTCIVIVEVQAEGQERQVMGVIVDAVNEVLEIAGTEMEAAPSFGTQIRTDFIRGMGKVGNRFVIVLDVDVVLAGDDLAGLVSGTDTAATALAA